MQAVCGVVIGSGFKISSCDGNWFTHLMWSNRLAKLPEEVYDAVILVKVYCYVVIVLGWPTIILRFSPIYFWHAWHKKGSLLFFMSVVYLSHCFINTYIFCLGWWFVWSCLEWHSNLVWVVAVTGSQGAQWEEATIQLYRWALKHHPSRNFWSLGRIGNGLLLLAIEDWKLSFQVWESEFDKMPKWRFPLSLSGHTRSPNCVDCWT